MRIDFNKLMKKGYEVHPEMSKDGKVCVSVTIQPTRMRDPQMLIDLLKEEYELDATFAWDVAERVHESQILCALRQST